MKYHEVLRGPGLYSWKEAYVWDIPDLAGSRSGLWIEHSEAMRRKPKVFCERAHIDPTLKHCFSLYLLDWCTWGALDGCMEGTLAIGYLA